jgi:mannosyltransferase OCH1-like enzyme
MMAGSFMHPGDIMTKRETFWMSTLPVVQQTYRIPKIIHQTFGTAHLTPELQRSVDALKAANPDWEYRFYDNAACERVIGDHFGEQVLSVYRRINPDYGPARADLFRYLLIYAIGGVYLDIKSFFDRPISNAIVEDDAFIISHWDNKPSGAHPGFGLHAELAHWPGGEIQQWQIIAAAGHPFLRCVIAKVLSNIEAYRPWRHGVGRIGVLRLTGPIPYTQAIRPLLDRYPHRRIANAAEIGLHYSLGGKYDHGIVFKRHYSLLTTPVADVPLWARPPALVYSYLKGKQQDWVDRATP